MALAVSRIARASPSGRESLVLVCVPRSTPLVSPRVSVTTLS